MEQPEDLARCALAGDRAALEALCRSLEGPVYRLALRMLGRQADAEDATQEILVTVVTHLSEFRGDAKLSTWVYTIASRHLLRRRASTHELRSGTMEDVARAVDLGRAATQVGEAPAAEVRLLARDVQRSCAQAMLLALTREIAWQERPEPTLPPVTMRSRARSRWRAATSTRPSRPDACRSRARSRSGTSASPRS